MSRVFINEYELLSCAGDTDELMRKVYSKESAIEIDKEYVKGTDVAIGRFSTGEFFDSLVDVVGTVLDKSNLSNFHDTLLIVGSSVGGMKLSEQIYFKENSYANIDPQKHSIAVISKVLDKEFNFADTRSISTACTSSANALLLAHRLIKLDLYSSVLVVGADALCHTTVCGFSALGVLSSTPCRSFDKHRDGMNVAEGIGALLLDSVEVDGSVELAGCGASSDAFHITNPDPEAKGAKRSMQHALDEAGVSSDEVDYINAHGTGTVANDRVEALAIGTMFTHKTAVSSTKPITGHTLGAAGAIEAIVCCEVIKRAQIPPQALLDEQESGSITLLSETKKADVKYLLSNSFAFGGNNTTLLFKALA